jgi:hypothetical protein
MSQLRRTRFASFGPIVIALALSSRVPLLGQGTASLDWASSLDAFLRDLATWHGPKPGASISMLNSGQLVSDKWEIMKKYRGRTVTWDATVKGVMRAKLLLSEEGGESKEMDKVDGTFIAKDFAVSVHAYIDPAMLSQWSAVSAGSRVAVTGRVGGVGFMGPLAGQLIHVVTLTDAVPKIIQ